jgi:ribosomal protein L12E/L44/L45/RPP1/RPP2
METDQKIIEILKSQGDLFEQIQSDPSVRRLREVLRETGIDLDAGQAEAIIKQLGRPLEMDDLEKVVGGVARDRTSFNKLRNED